jgi:FKBP-type peptidyl-prolyl cis-trans isomerase FkpA
MNRSSHLRFAAFVLGLAGATAGLAQESQAPAGDAAAPAADDASSYAAIGAGIAENMKLSQQHWTEAQFDAFVSGLRAGYNGQTLPIDAKAQRIFEEMNRRIADLQQQDKSGGSDQNRLERYMREAREAMHMQQTESGLLYHIEVPGKGPRPLPDDTIVVTFTARAPDGKTELPQLAGHQMRMKVGDLLPGLAEGIQLMALGGRILIIAPPQLTFADGQWPEGIDRGIPIWFDVQLDDIAAH